MVPEPQNGSRNSQPERQRESSTIAAASVSRSGASSAWGAWSILPNLAAGTYAGTGAAAKSLSFPFAPRMVLLADVNAYCTPALLASGISTYYCNIAGGGAMTGTITAFGTTVSWTSQGALYSFNNSGYNYAYVALG